MIIESMKIHNIGVYKGTHRFCLMPEAGSRTITLIGGLNGTGKTSFLEALQVGLLGRSAYLDKSANEYQTKLSQLISFGRRHASIEIVFRVYAEGTENRYTALRMIKNEVTGPKERFAVFQNQREDKFLSRNWQHQVNKFFPSYVKNLFFFDGEKISQYAEKKNLSRFIQSAVEKFFGIENVDRLKNDLEIHRSRIQGGIESATEISELKIIDEEIQDLRTRLSQERDRKASIQSNKVDKINLQLQEIEQEYIDRGGEYFENRQRIEKQINISSEKIAEIEKKLIVLAGTDIPFALIWQLLSRTWGQVNKEIEQKELIDRVKHYNERDKLVLSSLDELDAPKDIVLGVEKRLAESIQTANSGIDVDHQIDIDPSGYSQLNALVSHSVERVGSEAKNLVKEIILHRKELELAIDELSNVPEEGLIVGVIKKREELKEKQQMYTEELELCQSDLRLLQENLKSKEAQRTALLKEVTELKHKNEDTVRILTHSQRVAETLERLRYQLIANGIERVEKELEFCLKRVGHHTLPIESIKVDESSFVLTARNSSGSSVDLDSLSAGQKQLVCLAVLWAFRIATGWLLPIVIDTPLSRLDAIHRDNVLSDYLPNIGHQVVVLSTDREIDKQGWNLLRDSVARTYTLEFDDDTQATNVREGFFGIKEQLNGTS